MKTTRWWLKSAALLCATVFGLTAFGDYVWSGTATGWSDTGAWTGDSGNYVFGESVADIEVTMGSATTIGSALWVENGTESTVTLTRY